MGSIDLTSTKVLRLEALAEELARRKASGAKVVMCHGVFDLMHIGHIRHFEDARRHGDVLVVTLTPDRFVNKGPHRPVFSEALRAEAIAALRVVDYVAVNRWPTSTETIRMLRPDVYCKGGEYRTVQGDIQRALLEEIDAVSAVGARIEYTDDITFSSSQLINDNFTVFSAEADEWLRAFRRSHSIDEIMGFLDRASALKVLVVGDAILDEYVFCDGIGKSTKDPILVSLYRWTETYPGGSLAVANHLAGFCDDVGLVTLLGDSESREDFVRGALLPPVRSRLLKRQSAPTIHKRRFVDAYSGVRMFELYVMEDTPLSADDDRAVVATLEDVIPEYDVVVVCDYGHGLLTPAAIKTICGRARFLAVNTQANAGNRGFNTISKYPRADYVCLAGHEIALETRMRHAEYHDLVLEVTTRIDCHRFTVTQGKAGSLHYAADSGFTSVPALASRVTDRVGAGDAVLALSSLLVRQGAPWDVVGFVANVAGAQMVAELGNQKTVNRDSMNRHIVSLMK